MEPSFVLNFLDDERDRRALINGVKIARKVLGAPALAQYRGEELTPGESDRHALKQRKPVVVVVVVVCVRGVVVAVWRACAGRR